MGKLKADQVIKKITALNGNITSVATTLGVSRTTIYKMVEDYPTVRAALEEARETMLDNAESALYRNVIAGDNTAIIFFLKTQGKSRGYVERSELTGADGAGLTIKVVYGDDNA